VTNLLRPDLLAVAGLVLPGSRVLDVACGDGTLLAHLCTERQVVGRGMELAQRNVSECVARGLPVVQGNADTDLVFYPDKAFDVAILSKSLQVMQKPKDVLLEMARIADRIIVSIPNFGYIRNRLHLLLKGRMPVTKTLSYSWYETPNIHFSTLKDFLLLCEELHFSVEKRLAVTNDGKMARFGGYGGWANLFSEQAIFLLRGPS
jgi:methionine biosynthesis protein MetW